MFELLVIVFVFSLFGASLLVLLMAVLRFIDARKQALSWLHTVMATIIPAGVAYYAIQQKNTALKRWHRRWQWVAFVLVVVGSVFLLFVNVPSIAAAFFYGI